MNITGLGLGFFLQEKSTLRSKKYSLANFKHNLLEEIRKLLHDSHRLSRCERHAIHWRSCVVSCPTQSRTAARVRITRCEARHVCGSCWKTIRMAQETVLWKELNPIWVLFLLLQLIVVWLSVSFKCRLFFFYLFEIGTYINKHGIN